MSLEWTHDPELCPLLNCRRSKDCPAFPTTHDHINMAAAAFNEYYEADGTELQTFIQDVLMFAIFRGIEPNTIRELLGAARTEVHVALSFTKEPE